MDGSRLRRGSQQVRRPRRAPPGAEGFAGASERAFLAALPVHPAAPRHTSETRVRRTAREPPKPLRGRLPGDQPGRLSDHSPRYWSALIHRSSVRDSGRETRSADAQSQHRPEPYAVNVGDHAEDGRTSEQPVPLRDDLIGGKRQPPADHSRKAASEKHQQFGAMAGIEAKLGALA